MTGTTKTNTQAAAALRATKTQHIGSYIVSFRIAGGARNATGGTMKTCPDCNGDGVVEKGTDDEQQCPTCGGTGFVPDDDNDNEEVIRTGARP